MTDDREVSERPGERAPAAENPKLAEEGAKPPAPRGVDGESRVVAERSGADTSFPDRPLSADPVDVNPADAPDSGAVDPDAGQGAPKPEVGPAS
ncbi:hypothetical protein [Streptosporangium carneum]|uniref:Uncharacterized protein n=1 Tax=Streptosporangium carneum TaxID=47481 RepID=A0A9W6MBV4_9ACTN|nr:hypothetical protein [Streptosporangium carneum]GLK08739.1 hypothetical protein GCM10017600_21440 [Streptosporangium carneum]